MNDRFELIKANLQAVFEEICVQPEVGTSYPADQVNFQRHMALLREWIEDHREYGIAYESIVATLEKHPFRLSGQAAVKLLEVGLLFGFKTERRQDVEFDIRTKLKS